MTRPVSPEYRANYALIEWKEVVRHTVLSDETGQHKSSPVAAPHYISDIMEPTMHMATGEIIDSKSKFRQRTREAGCEEVGNSAFPKREPQPVPRAGFDIKRALEQLRGR